MKKFSEIVQKPKINKENHFEYGKAVVKGRFKIQKSDEEKKLAFGWANVSIRSNGEVIEGWQEDIVEPEELENAAYNFVELYREGGEMHERGGVGRKDIPGRNICESME